ncbi:MAG: recombinase family protein [Defluviitaleaceae bacterium]|nr:recombinase family protein [Defluviitaleaceae bacterium]MCL2275139.1 recombinase family protein [Defluviitaleaceae bacterium]
MPRTSRKNLPQGQPPVIATPKVLSYATWGYARISNDGERSEDSIENQTAIIQSYVADNPEATLELKGVISDLGFSGTNFDRPGYAELLAGITNGTVQCLVVKDLSRLGRTYIEVGELLFDTFPSYNVRFISVNDNYDSFADDAARKKLLILFKNLVNHMYSKDIGKKIKSIFALKQQKGEVFSSLPSYGYRLVRENGVKRVVVEPEGAEVVKRIFAMREQGISCHGIATRLNQDKIPPPKVHFYNLGIFTGQNKHENAIWQGGAVSKLLRNDCYIGLQTQGKNDSVGKGNAKKPKEVWYIHENAHPAIISKEQFHAVQALLDQTGEKYKVQGKKMDENIFVGVLFCARCGKALARTYNSRGKVPIYYYACPRCVAEIKQATGASTVTRLRLSKLEPLVFTVLQKQVEACVEMEVLLEDALNSTIIASKVQTLQAMLDKHQRDCKKADDMLASAYTHHLSGLLDSKDFDLARVKFEQEKQVASLGIERVQAELDNYVIKNQRGNAFLENFRRNKSFSKLDKVLVSAFIKRIEVTPLSNEINIVFNYMDELAALNNLIEESGVLANVHR